ITTIDAASPPTPRALDDLEQLFATSFVPNVSGAYTVAPDAAFDCIATASALLRGQTGASFAPDFTTKLQGATKSAADWLAQHVADGGGHGWGLPLTYADPNCGNTPGQWDAFQDGTCNAKGTVYAYQTGLSSMCLVLATVALGDPSYRTLASQVLT